MTFDWEKATKIAEEISASIEKVCEEYGLKITDKINRINDEGDYDIYHKTKLVSNNLFIEAITVAYFAPRYYNEQIVYVIEFWPEEDDIIIEDIIVQENQDYYNLVLEIFKTNNVLTEDEMIVKDIIE